MHTQSQIEFDASHKSLTWSARTEAFFSYGFRPFFLGASVYTALMMSVWLAVVATATAGVPGYWLPVFGSAISWHAHELVFGFAAAGIAGFLLTAVPNWTGALPLSGAPLAALFLVWFAGRIAMILSAALPYALVAAVDVLFLPLVGGAAAYQLFTRPAARNLVFLLILAALTAGDVVFHAGASGLLSVDPLAAARFSLFVVVSMIAIIGGRIIPAFTHNWMHLNAGHAQMPRRLAWLDALSIISIVVFALMSLGDTPRHWQGLVAVIAALSNGIRLSLWRGWATRTAPIVWILHIGYAWIVIGFSLLAVCAFVPSIPGTLAMHALGAGAIGTMILAVMSRASLGHTGRPIVATQQIVIAYVLVILSAVVRILGPLAVPQFTSAVLALAALAWIAAYALFAVVYAPILTTPRIHSKLAQAQSIETQAAAS